MIKHILILLAAAFAFSACSTTSMETCPHGGDSCCAKTPAKKK